MTEFHIIVSSHGNEDIERYQKTCVSNNMQTPPKQRRPYRSEQSGSSSTH